MTLRRAMGLLNPMHGIDLRCWNTRYDGCRGFLKTRFRGMVSASVNATTKIVRNKTHILQVFNRTRGVDPFEMNNLASMPW